MQDSQMIFVVGRTMPYHAVRSWLHPAAKVVLLGREHRWLPGRAVEPQHQLSWRQGHQGYPRNIPGILRDPCPRKRIRGSVVGVLVSNFHSVNSVGTPTLRSRNKPCPTYRFDGIDSPSSWQPMTPPGSDTERLKRWQCQKSGCASAGAGGSSGAGGV